jgi:hypothetical protein
VLLRGYGTELAAIMLYGDNSYLTPQDDAPRVVDVHSNPARKQYLEVGIGRPRAFYVLYPWKGGETLCGGSVLPYYEFSHGTRLTDAVWRSLLDTAQRPEVPAWLRPVVSATPPARPAGRDDKE